jgi:hypothetical protein
MRLSSSYETGPARGGTQDLNQGDRAANRSAAQNATMEGAPRKTTPLRSTGAWDIPPERWRRNLQPGRSCALLLGLALAAIGTVACAPGEATDPAENENANGNASGCVGDADGDGICDEHEDRADAVDTDGDATPDYLDLDSDGDGIGDDVERGGGAPGAPPVDSDGDGIPDFRDDDSDDNGIPDWKDGVIDTDENGVGAYADPDDDGDGILDSVEIGPDVDSPRDSDGDGTPDHQDLDSDGDRIADALEGTSDSDEDGVADYLDLDSDDDCIPDAAEAGDELLETRPLDSDGDGHFDFRDADSDNDGLADGAEDLDCSGGLDPGETDPRAQDTDGDGVWDLIETAAETDPQDPADNPQSHGNFVFLMPYTQPAEPTSDTLEFATSIRYADLYFSFDTTGSMGDELSAMSQHLPTIIDTLRCQELNQPCLIDSDCPGPDTVCGPHQECMQDPLAGDGCVADLWTGLGTWDELDTFRNLVTPQSDPHHTAAAFPGTGTGAQEAPLQAPACVADGSNCQGGQAVSLTACAQGADTCAGFRDDAIRILIQITDADDQCYSPGGRCNLFTAAYTGAELMAKQIKFIGLYGSGDSGGAGTPRSIAEDLGIASGTIDPNGQPFVYEAVDQAVVDQTVAAVLDIVRSVTLGVTIEAEDLPGDAGDALAFIDHLAVNVSGAGACTAVPEVTDTDGDGHDDAFPSLLPGTPVCWDVHPVGVNDFAEPGVDPQVFKARLTVRGDGSPLDAREVYFLVPPEIQGPGAPQ